MGEYTAACLAGVFTLEDAVALVAKRGELFETLPPGSMLSVLLSEGHAREHLGAGLDIAAINRPNACVISGEAAAIDDLERRFGEAAIDSTRVHISVAAHSSMVEPILSEFRAFIGTLSLASPKIPLVSNVSDDFISDGEARNPDYWVRHLRQTVRFSSGLNAVFRDGDCALLEVGPGQTLSSLASQHPGRGRDRAIVASVRHPRERVDDIAFLLTALGRLWVAGVDIDWRELQLPGCRRVSLPTYPFESRRYWIDAAPGEATEPRSAASTPATVAPSSLDPTLTRLASGATIPSESTRVASESTRKDRVAAVIRRVLHDLSGIEVESLDDHATFLALGLDSLLLTQASAAFQRQLGVRVTFRQLFEDAPTIDTLAAYIDGELPEGTLQPKLQTSEASDTNAALPEQPPHPGDARDRAGAGHGPWQPVDRSTGTLDGRQRRHLEGLIQRLNQRSPKSKALTQANRSHLADPRTVAGFRLPWKELVYPVVVERSLGSRVWDIDGNEWLDITMGFGVSLFGHAPRFITEAVQERLASGYEIGPQTALAGEVAALICELTGMKRVAFCNTGSEAVLAALRTARTVTGRSRVATFVGDYHGIFDEMLGRRVGTGPHQRTIPIAPGIPPRMVEDVLMLEYGDEVSLESIREHAHELAAVLVEPVQSRHPGLQPVEFLRALRKITTECDVPLIFDEMITGFRCHLGGVQALYDIRADITTYGKVIGGGFPIGVVAGRRHFMDALDGGMWRYGDASMPEAGVTWFAGTFVRHPVALAAARAALLHMQSCGPELQTQLNARTSAFVDDLNRLLTERGAPIRLEHFSSFFLVRFLSHRDYASLFYF